MHTERGAERCRERVQRERERCSEREAQRLGFGIVGKFHHAGAQARSAAQSLRLSRLSASFITRDPAVVGKVHQEGAESLTLSANLMIGIWDSLFTNSRHARVHHPPRGTQAACAQLKHQFSPRAGPPSTQRLSSSLCSAQTSILAMRGSTIHPERDRE